MSVAGQQSGRYPSFLTPTLSIKSGEVWTLKFREKPTASKVVAVKSGPNKGTLKYRIKVTAWKGDEPPKNYVWFVPPGLSRLFAKHKSFVRLTSTYSVWRFGKNYNITDRQTGVTMAESKIQVLKVLSLYANEGVERIERWEKLTTQTHRFILELLDYAERFFPHDPEAQALCMRTLLAWIKILARQRQISPCPPVSMLTFASWTKELSETPFNPGDEATKQWEQARGTVQARRHGFEDDKHLMRVFGVTLDAVKCYEQCLLYAQETYPGRPYAQALLCDTIGTHLLEKEVMPVHKTLAKQLATERNQVVTDYAKEKRDIQGE